MAKGSSKGKNAAKCKAYKTEGRRERNKLRKLLKHRDLKFTHTTVSHLEICQRPHPAHAQSAGPEQHGSSTAGPPRNWHTPLVATLHINLVQVTS